MAHPLESERLDERARDQLDTLRRLLPEYQAQLAHAKLPGHVASDLEPIVRSLDHISGQGLARGPVFCEWGSGLGFATLVAALFGFEAYGIERHEELVDAARELAEASGIDAVFACGSFQLPGDEATMEGSRDQARCESAAAYDDLGLEPGDCDLVFSYPWPGEEQRLDEVFLRHSSPGALLLTFHDSDRMLLQRHEAGVDELVPIGWI